MPLFIMMLQPSSILLLSLLGFFGVILISYSIIFVFCHSYPLGVHTNFPILPYLSLGRKAYLCLRTLPFRFFCCLGNIFPDLWFGLIFYVTSLIRFFLIMPATVAFLALQPLALPYFIVFIALSLVH